MSIKGYQIQLVVTLDWCVQMLAKFADDARIEQLTVEKRRLKTLEHRRQVQQLLEERQQRRRQEWEQLAKLEALRQAEEKHR